MIAQIVLEKTTYSFDILYSYSVPKALENLCKPGCRVVVPFGNGNSLRQGMVVSLGDTEYKEKLKEVISVVDKEPVITEEMLKLCLWFHETLFCTYFDAVNAVLPTGISLKMVDTYSQNKQADVIIDNEELPVFEFVKANSLGVKLEKIIKKFGAEAFKILDNLESKCAVIKSTVAVQRMADATQKSVRIVENNESTPKLTSRQTEILEIMKTIGAVTVKELQYFTGVSASVIDNLVRNNLLEYYDKPIYRLPKYEEGKAEPQIVLTDEQQAAFDTLKGKLDDKNSALLYGVTGSGKTKVFLKLVDEVIKKGKGVIIMVPEISLTPQTISAFNNRYKNKIAVFHSSMSLGQRMDEWKRIKDGEALIAIGTRSAVFAPFKDLGLIIMDEEHEHTYKSEQSPRFHAKDVAAFRSAYHKCLFLMASATPSIKTFSNALSGKYTLCKLNKRYGNAALPEILTVDMLAEQKSGNNGILSRELYEKIADALDNKKQAIVLLNRRGHNTYVSCPYCGYVASCPNCSVSLTYHSANNRMMCHYCGHSVPLAKTCPECENETMKFSGAGTQKAEEELKMLFPNANILRLDADSTMARGSFSEHLTSFSEGKYDILLGTQMVAKGLDFPNVTVVGVIGADSSALSSDYKSAERTFSLLTQVVGRAGRGEDAGVAVIQSNEPNSSIITLAAKQDYEAFYNDEIGIRKLMIYPPFCDVISLLVTSINQNEALNTAKKVLNNIKELAEGDFSDVKVIALGPAAAQMPRVNNKYRFTLFIKCKNNKRTRDLIREAININLSKDVSISVDVNPETLI